MQVLSESAFKKAVLNVLRGFDNNEVLERSKLIHSAMLRRFSPKQSLGSDCLRDLFRDSIAGLADGPAGARPQQLLALTYLSSKTKKLSLAGRMHMSERSYRRHLRQAEEALVADLWARELRQHAKADSMQ